MPTALLAILIVLVTFGIALVGVVLVRSQRSTDQDRVGNLEQRLAEMVQAQQSLVGKIDVVSQQQITSSKALTDSLSQAQQQLGKQVDERLASVQSVMGDNLSVSAEATAKSLG
ncbi:MAG: hypothetical protein ACR2N7_01635, partial [Acidimicrobiia bacterium]